MSATKDLDEETDEMRMEVINDIIFGGIPEGTSSEFWDYILINEELAACFGSDISLPESGNLSRDDAVNAIWQQVKSKTGKKEALYSPEIMRHMERTCLLRLIDQYWKEHLLILDRLRQGINLRAYGQRDPLNEYKQEAFYLFEMMSKTIRKETVKALSLFELPASIRKEDVAAAILGRGDGSEYDDNYNEDYNESYYEEKPEFAAPTILRNAPCPCGSSKKYKHCCGKIE
jgi:preprotein translocase subunit SecA